MIFVTVGTTDFDALIRRMDELAPTLGEEVVCQIGRGSYVPRHCRFFRFAPALEDYIRAARLVVSHGGLGSIVEVLGLRRPLVGVSNPDRRDLHQDDLLSTFERRNHLIWCRSLADLPEAIARAGRTTFAVYQEPPCTIPAAIHAFLRDGTAARRRGSGVPGRLLWRMGR